MIKEIDRKVKKNKNFKITIVVLSLIIFLIGSVLISMYLFPEKFDNYSKMPMTMIMYKVEDDFYGTHVSDYYIEYNKIFKYPITNIGTYGATTKKEQNVNKNLLNIPNFKNIQEHIDSVKNN